LELEASSRVRVFDTLEAAMVALMAAAAGERAQAC
jgi:hypothetical protein